MMPALAPRSSFDMLGSTVLAPHRPRSVHDVGLTPVARRHGKKPLAGAGATIKSKTPPRVNKENVRVVSGSLAATPVKGAGKAASTPETAVTRLRFSKSASPLTTPTQASHAAHGRKHAYGDIGLGHNKRGASGPHFDPEAHQVIVSVMDGGYSSLQEMLESSGFTDTRIITPIAARSSAAAPLRQRRRPVSPVRGRSYSPNRGRDLSEEYPPYSLPLRERTLRASTSMRLLKGVIGLWSSVPSSESTTTPNEEPPESDLAGTQVRIEEARNRDLSRLRATEWIVQVDREREAELSRSCSPPTHSHLAPISTRTYNTLTLPTNTTLGSRPMPPSPYIAPAASPVKSIAPQVVVAPTAAFTFQPRPLILSASSRASSAASISSSMSVTSNRGRRVFSRPVATFSDLMDATSRGNREIEYQSFSGGAQQTLSNFHDHMQGSPVEGEMRREYDDADEDEEEVVLPSVAPVPIEAVSSVLMRHWKSLVSLPASLLAQQSSASTLVTVKTTPPLPFSSDLPRPAFLDIPYTPQPAATASAAKRLKAKSTLDLRGKENQVRRKPSQGPSLLRKATSSAALRPVITKTLGEAHLA